ncbi:copper chaperone PCu(A)C [Pseudodonghicola xiamenensis]|uniref:Copper(I)-binding protein n=2 Tax=Pseudodonghicola xiamenensis TaxID=337702 RepID=A0A8J3MDF8_9RHOB|nr:copper chaperone PCu(A)C [Pseudodonghicola xiamenensis]GHG98640.1 hypothetical protein GCM10010961_34130 [Pseudodonghicola xiamenensis]
MIERTKPMRHLLLVAALLAPALVSAEERHDHHLSELQGVRALHAWTRATGADKALVFVELENDSPRRIVIEGAGTDIAKSAGLVGFQLVDGEPSYSALPPLPIEPGREMHLDPNGMAILLTGLTHELTEGEEFDLHLETSLGELELHVAVEAANASQHSHAGHSH